MFKEFGLMYVFVSCVVACVWVCVFLVHMCVNCSLSECVRGVRVA